MASPLKQKKMNYYTKPLPFTGCVFLKNPTNCVTGLREVKTSCEKVELGKSKKHER